MLVEPLGDNERGKLALGAVAAQSEFTRATSYQGRQICRVHPSRRCEGLHEEKDLEP